jgi:hypothetical protein
MEKKLQILFSLSLYTHSFFFGYNYFILKGFLYQVLRFILNWLVIVIHSHKSQNL